MGGIGAALGVLAVLSLHSLVMYARHRDRADAGAAAYGLLIVLTLAQVNGVFNAIPLFELPLWHPFDNYVFQLLSIGATLLFLRHLFSISTRFSKVSQLLKIAGLAIMASPLLFLWMDLQSADVLGNLLLLVGTLLGLTASLLCWRGGSSMGRWLTIAYVPQFVCVMRLLLDTLGILPVMWEIRYAISACVALSVPALLYALSEIHHNRRDVDLRARHLPSQDALTGLLTKNAFLAKLKQNVRRVLESREQTALILVEFINHEHIRKLLGDTVAEECLLRCTVKIHRISRDTDTVGRVAPARFGLVLDGARDRDHVVQSMTRLIASGLTPVPGLVPEVVLQFHVACVLLHEFLLEPDLALEELNGLLDRMSSRTRRKIRFLEVPHQPLQADSSLLQDEKAMKNLPSPRQI